MINPSISRSTIRLLLAAALFGLVVLPSPAADMVPFADITPAQAAALIAEKGTDPLFTIIDVRTPAEFAENRIKGALNIDVKAPDFKERIEKLERSGVYLAYCRGGVRSARAMNLMKESGFKQVYNLGGGLMKWQEEKRPLEAATAPAAPSSGCGPAAPAADTHAWLGGKNNTTVPFRLYRNHVHIEAELNGAKKLELILDTGMPAPGILVFSEKPVAGLGLAYAGETRISGAGSGSSAAKVAAGVSIRIGDLLLKDQTAIVRTGEAAAPTVDRPVAGIDVDADGIIGYALLGPLVVAIDFDRMLLTLSEPRDFAYSGQGSVIPLRFESNFPFIDCPARLAGGAPADLGLIVDLGASHAVSLNAGSRPGLEVPNAAIPFWGRGAGGEVSGRQARIESLTLGKFVLKGVVASFYAAKLMPLEKEGNLGSDVLRRFNLVFDYSRRVLIIEPNSRFGEPFETGMSGLFAEKTAAGEFVVRHVLAGSPAGEAKLQEGDRIEKVDGRPAGGISSEELFKATTREGKSLTLAVRRGDARFTVILKLRRLI